MFRDVLEIRGIKEAELFRIFLKYVLRSYSAYVSIGKISKYFRSLGFGTSNSTVSGYLSALNQAFFIYPIKILAKEKVVEQYPKKLYLADTGFTKLLLHQDYGRLIENLVFLELLRKMLYSGKEFEIRACSNLG